MPPTKRSKAPTGIPIERPRVSPSTEATMVDVSAVSFSIVFGIAGLVVVAVVIVNIVVVAAVANVGMLCCLDLVLISGKEAIVLELVAASVINAVCS